MTDASMALDCANEGAEDLIEGLQCWGLEATIVAHDDSWLLFIEGALMTAASGEDPVTAMDHLYNRVIELFVSDPIRA